MKLPKDATLRDLRPMLADPDAFVSRAYGVIHRAAKENGEVALRLGVMGTGQYPNYRIEHSESGEPITAYNGANHEPWPDGEKFDGAATWSDNTMTKSEVETLLGEIRNFTRKS